MVRAEDVATTRNKEKPYDSIIPYLRAKEAEKKAENKEKLTTVDLDNPTNSQAFYINTQE